MFLSFALISCFHSQTATNTTNKIVNKKQRPPFATHEERRIIVKNLRKMLILITKDFHSASRSGSPLHPLPNNKAVSTPCVSFQFCVFLQLHTMGSSHIVVMLLHAFLFVSSLRATERSEAIHFVLITSFHSHDEFPFLKLKLWQIPSYTR